MNTNGPVIYPLYYKADSIYYRITEIERSWSTEAAQNIYTLRGTSYQECNGMIDVENYAVLVVSEKDMSKKMKMITRKAVMNFIGKFV